MIERLPRAALACALALTLGACGGGDSGGEGDAPPPDAPAEGEASPPAEVEPAPSGSADGPVTVADIDAWRKGMAAELQAVRGAGARMKEAKTNDDSLAALMGVQETATQEVGAAAGGLPLDRYRFVRDELSAAVSYLTPQLGGIDTSLLSPEQRAELRRSNEEQLQQMQERVPADVVEALRPQAEALRKQNLELVGTRLKSAGM
jgi:hypothetical protein